ncbi:MAG: HD domain-containing protein, partial [Planctomycetota bacterium]|nr:HD domain-containing protein [Planctomycetota bacterium]
MLPTTLNINPVWLIRSLSMALELALTGVTLHHWRTAIICRYLADIMGLDLLDKQNLLMSTLLHDIGAASDYDERLRIMDPERRQNDPEIYSHAEDGYRLLSDSCCFQPLAEAVRHHHDKWDGGNPSGLAGDDIPQAARIIHLADVIEVNIDRNSPLGGQRDNLIRLARGSMGKDQDPEAVNALLSASEKDCLWLDLANPSYADILFRDMDSWVLTSYTSEDMLSIAHIYASIIDRMSIFTATHSRSVSKVSSLLAAHCGFCRPELEMMETAGLLHDLGKLTIPNEILEKPGKLSPDEMRLMRQHTYHT